MSRWVERNTADLVPIKSSLSIILGDTQVWSNVVCASALTVLSGVEDASKLDAFAERLVEAKKQECERRTKKSRQVFTLQPPAVGVLADFIDKQIEVYETGQDVCGVEPHLVQGVQSLPSSYCRLPDVVKPLRSHVQSAHSLANSDVYLPLAVCSEHGLKTCFPTAKSDLLYSVSDSSLPIRSLSRSSQKPDELAISLKTYGISPRCSWLRTSHDLTGRSFLISPLCKDILIKCRNMDNSLAAETIQRFTDKARRRKFMSYAKFNSSFKLSEVFYEDINRRRSSRVPSLARSLQLSRLVHKINPDFDENQSLSEAMTVMSLSSITPISHITEVYRPPVSANYETSRNALNCDGLPPNFTCSEPARSVEVSSTSENSAVSYAQVVSTARKQLSEFQDALKSSFQKVHKETDIRSCSTCQFRAVPKRLVDFISPFCIFGASVGHERPLWQLKSSKSVDGGLTDFLFKAHFYMRVKGRPSYRCFFQQPTYRVVDEGVQFPDVALAWDRSPNVKEPLSENITDIEPPDPPRPSDSSVELTVMPSFNACTESQTEPNLDVIVACDKPLNYTSDQTVSSDAKPNQLDVTETADSSLKLPESASSDPRNKTSPQVPEEPVPKRHRRQKCPEPDKFCRSYRAFCDKRRIKIRYENGKYTVLKEMDKSKRQTVWSILTKKATHLLNSVVRRKPRARQTRRR